MKSFFLFVACFLLATTCVAVNPVPFVSQPLIPAGKAPGSAAFTLHVSGAGFAPGATVYWNGSPRSTNFVSAAQLTATIPASDLALPLTAAVTVVNPVPGGGRSAPVYFHVTNSLSAISLASLVTLFFDGGSTSLRTATGDFNNDGNVDVVYLGEQNFAGVLAMFLGNGFGTFEGPVYSGGLCNVDLAADVNGDGNLDMVSAGSVCLGNGDGTFLAPLSGLGDLSGPLVAGDFNGDGKVDIVGQGLNGVSLALGNRDGTFQSALPITSLLSSPLVGDFNGDGKLDVAGISVPNRIGVVLGNGDGTFQAPIFSQVGTTPAVIAAGDFNQDGKLDLATGNNATNAVSILLGRGNGSFQTHVDYPVAAGPTEMLLADFNADGTLDIVTATSMSGEASVLLGNGNGTLQPTLNVNLLWGAPVRIVTGEFQSGSLTDIAMAGASLPVIYNPTPVPIAAVSPAQLTFPAQLVGGKSRVQNVILSNTGSGPMSVYSVTVSGDFTQTNACPSTLAASASCTIGVVFSPTQIGTETGTIVVTDNSEFMVNATQKVSLTGVGTVISLAPAQLAFPATKVGVHSAPLNVTLTNHSLQAIGINGVTIVGTNAGDFSQTNTCGNVVAARGQCTVIVVFTPTATGARSARLKIVDNGGGSPQLVPLSGTGD